MGVAALLAGCSGASEDATSKRDDVVAVSAASAGMQRAMQLGAKSWPDGYALYQALPSGQPRALLVKLGFPVYAGGIEYMWVQVTGKAGNEYSGVLTNEPLSRSDWRQGDSLAFEDLEVVDWVLHVDGQPSRGGFTSCQIAKHERPGGRAAAYLIGRPHDCDWAISYELRFREGPLVDKLPPV